LADEVEIGNVGGEGGVASEATLASLTRAIEKLAASTGRDPKKEAGKLQQQYNEAVKSGITVSTKNRDALEKRTDATKKATAATNKYSRALISAAGGVIGNVAVGLKNMGEALLDGKNNLTDFAKHVPLVGNYLSVLTGVIDANIENFRALSQVGAVFGDGLNDIRATAAQAGMPLGDFVDLVSQNSESMKLFGASTAAGAKNFAAMSKELRQGPGKTLMNLGFTSGELNELLIDYAEMQSMAFTRDRIQGRVSAENAAAFGEEMVKITAITGKRRDQIEAELKQQSGDIRMRAAMASMEGDERDRFRLNIADISGESQALANALIDFQDGIPSDEVTRRLMGYSKTFEQFGADVSNMSPDELNQFVVDVRQDLENFAGGNKEVLQELMASIPGMSEAFGIVGETAKRSIPTEQEKKDRKAAMELEKTRNEGLKNFNETINKVLADLTMAFITSGALELIQTEIESVATMFSEFVKGDKFQETIKEAAETVRKFIENFKNFDLKTALFGGKRTVTEVDEGDGSIYTREVDVEGLLPDDMFSGIGDYIGSALTSAITSPTVLAAVAGIFLAPKLLNAFTSGIGSLFGGGGESSPKSRANAGKGAGNAIGNIGSGIGKGLGGILKGLAAGIKAFASPKIALGAAGLAAAIALIGGAIAGATWMVGAALPTMSEGLKSFEDLDATKLIDAGEGMKSLAGGLAALGGGTIVSGIGSLFQGEDGFNSILEQLTEFQNYDIDSERVRRNAQAMSAFGEAMSAQGAGAISSGIGSLVGAISDFFGGDTPFEQVQEFGNLEINAEGVRANAQAMASMSRALSTLSGIDVGDVDIPRRLVNRLTELSEMPGGGLTATAQGMTAIANVQGLQTNLDILNTGLDIDKVRDYNEVMENLVETLGELNEVLAEDNEGLLGGGTGVASADVLGQINTSSAGSAEGMNRLNSLMSQVLLVLQEIATDADQIERNTASAGSNLANGRVTAIR